MHCEVTRAHRNEYMSIHVLNRNRHVNVAFDRGRVKIDCNIRNAHEWRKTFPVPLSHEANYTNIIAYLHVHDGMHKQMRAF